MYFAVWAHDRPGQSALRERLRPEHRLWLRNPGMHPVQVRLGGPLLDACGAMNGTMLVVEAENESAVQAFFRDDPYVRNHLFERVEVQQWLWGLGQPQQEMLGAGQAGGQVEPQAKVQAVVQLERQTVDGT